MSAAPLPTDRAELLARLAGSADFDVAIVGGGATGLGVALDAAARGFRVVLIEDGDFARGTSSRSTKLVHGGVRYLAQGNLSLVREALRERTILLRNAPHLARPIPFVMPSYKVWEAPFYGFGLKLYDALAAEASLGDTRFLGRRDTLDAIPNVRSQGLRGGVQYWDGQFDDARLAIALARTAATRGALLLNRVGLTCFDHDADRVVGLQCIDHETGRPYAIRAACVINATGVWVDTVRGIDAQAAGRAVRPTVSPSQGVHIVVDRDFLPGDHALLVPRTEDGRVLFAVPWLGKTVIGTTDTPQSTASFEPRAQHDELAFLLRESARHLDRAPAVTDIRSIWVGLRPLLRPASEPDASGKIATRTISREHAVMISPSGLVTVTGGKWTTYRSMAEDVLEHCARNGLLEHRPAGVTRALPMVGGGATPGALRPLSDAPGSHLYGDEVDLLAGLPGADHQLIPGLTEAMVRFAARFEYARTVEDVLARRSRLLFLDANAARRVAPEVARILTQETGLDPALAAFEVLAARYADPLSTDRA
jgi:glycerol-3-phosphate dehydrogenase